jgi:hemolysin D
MPIKFADHQVSPTIRLTAWTLILAAGVIIIASLVSKIEIVARGQGKIVPTGKVQIIQAQESGKVADILIKEGETVKISQPLIELDKSDAQSLIDQLSSEIERQSLEKSLSRLVLDAFDANDPTSAQFSKAAAAASAQDQSLHRLVVSTLQAIQDEITQIDAEIEKLARSAITQDVKISTGNEELVLAQQRYTSALALRKSGTISQFDMLEREENLKKVKGHLAVATHEAAEINAAVGAIQKQRDSIISKYKASFEDRFNAASAALQGLQGQLTRQQVRLKNAALLAPIDGKVENLKVTTIGAFVEAGTPILTIVPISGSIEIEAYFENRDIGFLQVGQDAFIKLDAFPAERFGVVKGKVISVGADARDPKTNNTWVYAVRLSLEKDHVLSNRRPIQFVAGMTATIDVVTGARKVASYFFEPIVKAMQDSFGER